MNDHVFKLGPDKIEIVNSYKHLGIENDRHLSSRKCIFDAGNKLRGLLLSVQKNGINPEFVNPITTYKLYY